MRQHVAQQDKGDATSIVRRGLVDNSNFVFRAAAWDELLLVPPEIVEDTNEGDIEIGSHTLAQLRRCGFGFGNNLRARGLPLCEEFVYLSLALEIEPEKDRACVAMRLSERGISNEQPAIPPGDAGDSTFLVAPIEGEAQRLYIVGSSLIEVGC